MQTGVQTEKYPNYGAGNNTGKHTKTLTNHQVKLALTTTHLLTFHLRLLHVEFPLSIQRHAGEVKRKLLNCQ